MVSNKHAYATDSTVGRAAGGRREDSHQGPGAIRRAGTGCGAPPVADDTGLGGGRGRG